MTGWMGKELWIDSQIDSPQKIKIEEEKEMYQILITTVICFF
jgi:hypothetical protein